MKIAIVIAFLCLIGYARSDVRLSVYNSSGCSVANVIGFINAPASVYDESVFRTVSCTATSGGQYYDVKKNQADLVLEGESEFIYFLATPKSLVNSDCRLVNEINSYTYAAKPDVCMNYGPFATTDADNRQTSFKFSSCDNSGSKVQLADSFGCDAAITTIQNHQCAIDDASGVIALLLCDSASSTPGTTAPTTDGTPSTAPVSVPSKGPAAVTTPAKASSASLTSFSIVAAAAAAFGYFL